MLYCDSCSTRFRLPRDREIILGRKGDSTWCEVCDRSVICPASMFTATAERVILNLVALVSALRIGAPR